MTVTYGAPASGGAVPLNTVQKTKDTGSGVLAPYFLINPPSTATLSNVAGSASSVTILASNADRVSGLIFNDSTALLYLKFGTTASSTSHTVQLPPASLYELPLPVYTGILTGIWTSATGSARVTELV